MGWVRLGWWNKMKHMKIFQSEKRNWIWNRKTENRFPTSSSPLGCWQYGEEGCRKEEAIWDVLGIIKWHAVRRE